MKSPYFRQILLWLACMFLMIGQATAAEVEGVKVDLVDHSGAATLSVKAIDQYALHITVDPQTERKAREVQIVLPISGRNIWPVNDVAVFDSKGRAIPVRRNGIEWHKLLVTLAPEQNSIFVRAVKTEGQQSVTRSEKERHVTDPKTGLKATICNWYDGRQAALSIRFDDSHPTHLSKAIPILNEYGFCGTFMVNPGGHPPNSRVRSAFEDHRSEWEAVASRGKHEFANHTLNHHGAQNDQSMEREVADASTAIWKLCPDKSRLLALNLGGGTQWVTTRPLRYYLDKYHLFDASANSTGMDDTYGKRVETFRRLLKAHLERGLWYKVHYHYIGEGLSTSEANFRAALDIAKQHQHQLWIAGMGEIHKYQTERRGASLKIAHQSKRLVKLKVSCTTELALYDQPLTMEITLPETWKAGRVVVSNQQDKEIKFRKVVQSDGNVLRFDVRPTDSEYSIENFPQSN